MYSLSSKPEVRQLSLIHGLRHTDSEAFNKYVDLASVLDISVCLSSFSQEFRCCWLNNTTLKLCCIARSSSTYLCKLQSVLT